MSTSRKALTSQADLEVGSHFKHFSNKTACVITEVDWQSRLVFFKSGGRYNKRRDIAEFCSKYIPAT